MVQHVTRADILLLLVFFLFSLGFGKESYYATSKISARIICQTIEYGL